MFIQSGEVRVNGEIENRRGRQLKDGDVVELGDIGRFRVVSEASPHPH